MCLWKIKRGILWAPHSLLGVGPLASKVNAIANFPHPTVIKQLQEFVGKINYSHHFILYLTHTMEPLYATLTENPKTLLCEMQQEGFFTKAKKSLAAAISLSFPTPNTSISLSTDASITIACAVLDQIADDNPRPMGFFSRRSNTPTVLSTMNFLPST